MGGGGGNKALKGAKSTVILFKLQEIPLYRWPDAAIRPCELGTRETQRTRLN